MLLAVGVSTEGYREVLGVWVADSESEASWGEVFSDLSRRGLRGVQYVVSDDHQGMHQRRYFSQLLRDQANAMPNSMPELLRTEPVNVVATLGAPSHLA